MRRGVGISGLNRHTASTASYASLSNTISTQQITDLKSQLESFRTALIAFSKAHNADIKKDPALRHQFQKMCAAIGVDPLIGGGARGQGKAGMWGDMLGMSDWTYQLAVQVVDVCVSNRDRNGGMMEMNDLLNKLHRLRDEPEGTLSPEDIGRAIKILKPLGAGYEVVQVNRQSYVRSVASELDTDQATLLGCAGEQSGRLKESDVMALLGWNDMRTRSAFDAMVKRDGLAWVDEQAEGGMEIWVPSTMVWEEAV
jgi:ESCRT-II complex subunit VPS22